jgi:hypothetical protein
MSRLLRSTPFLVGLCLALFWFGCGAYVIYTYGYALLHNAVAIACGFPDVTGPAYDNCSQAKISHALASGFWQSYVLDNALWTAGPALLLLIGGTVIALLQRPKSADGAH